MGAECQPRESIGAAPWEPEKVWEEGSPFTLHFGDGSRAGEHYLFTKTLKECSTCFCSVRSALCHRSQWLSDLLLKGVTRFYSFLYPLCGALSRHLTSLRNDCRQRSMPEPQRDLEVAYGFILLYHNELYPLLTRFFSDNRNVWMKILWGKRSQYFQLFSYGNSYRLPVFLFLFLHLYPFKTTNSVAFKNCNLIIAIHPPQLKCLLMHGSLGISNHNGLYWPV